MMRARTKLLLILALFISGCIHIPTGDTRPVRTLLLNVQPTGSQVCMNAGEWERGSLGQTCVQEDYYQQMQCPSNRRTKPSTEDTRNNEHVQYIDHIWEIPHDHVAMDCSYWINHRDGHFMTRMGCDGYAVLPRKLYLARFCKTP